MSATGQRNNNKAWPNLYAVSMPLTDGTTNKYLCFICRQIWTNTSTAFASFRDHLINEHQWTNNT